MIYAITEDKLLDWIAMTSAILPLRLIWLTDHSNPPDLGPETLMVKPL